MKDLAKRAAEHFGSREHDWKVYSEIDICHKCGCKGYNTSPCPIPDPIDITDRGKALECYRNTCADVPNKTMDGYVKDMMHKNWRMENFYADGQVILNLHWILLKATAEQIWEINCLAKESEK